MKRKNLKTICIYFVFCFVFVGTVFANFNQDGLFDFSLAQQKQKPTSTITYASLTQSIRTLRGLLKDDPLNSEVYVALALNYTRINEYDKAITVLTGARDFGENSPLLNETLGDIYDKKRDFDNSIASYEQLVEVDFLNYSAHLKLAYAYLKQARFSNAYRSYKKVIEINPFVSDAYYYLGLISIYEKDYSAAKTYFEAVIEYDNSQVYALNNLGVLAQRFDQEWDALRYFQSAITAYPKYEIALVNLGRLLLKKGRYAQAQQHLELALDINPKREKTYYLLGVIYEYKKEHANAIKMFLYLSAAYPKNINYSLILARLYKSTSDFERSEKCYLSLIDSNDVSRHCLIDYGILLSDMNRSNDAIGIFEQLLETNPNDSRTHFLLAKEHLVRFQLGQSLRHYFKSGRYIYTSVMIIALVFMFIFVVILSFKIFFQLYS